MIVVFTTRGLATANVVVVVVANHVPTAPITAVEDDSIEVDKGG